MGNYKEDVIAYAEREYKIRSERPWQMSPDNVVLRHEENRKWFGLLMEVRASSLGMQGEDWIPVLNVRLDPEMILILRVQEGFLPAYHMNKKNWMTIRLDGSVSMEQICMLLDTSYQITLGKGGSGSGKIGPKDWLVPSNPKYFDLVGAFEAGDEVLWKQSSDVKAGELVYMYVGAPYSALMYKCRALEVNLPYEGKHEVLNITRVMRLKRLYRYDPKDWRLEKLKDYGIVSVRGPRYLPKNLKEDLDWTERRGGNPV